ncbi:phospholipase A and acyltransferase 3-like [Engraulis encrasicolus]|uniref:phospholipase A and acyltransferase 3-like n=1 Tax=Engraulis encrasicolus TaxID=184585 RepID=UPI002FD6AF4B
MLSPLKNLFYYDKEPGDLIEIFRIAYQHWAVYVGDGYVIHLAPTTEQAGGGPAMLMSVAYNTALVRKEKLQDVVGTDKWNVNNILDERYEPFSPEEIVERAESMLDQELPYRVAQKNCEHFATNMRYGMPESRQVQRAVDAVLGNMMMPRRNPVADLFVDMLQIARGNKR